VVSLDVTGRVVSKTKRFKAEKGVADGESMLRPAGGH